METPSGGGEIVVAARVPHNLRDSADEIPARSGVTRPEYIRNALKMVVTAERACRQSEAVSIQAIRAEIIGANCAKAEGLTTFGEAPVLRLCRELLKAGHDPARPLKGYRGEVLCLRVCSIAEAAWLTVRQSTNDGRPRFVPLNSDGRPPMRLIESPGLAPSETPEKRTSVASSIKRFENNGTDIG